MNDIVENLNSSLDELISQARSRGYAIDARVEEKFKDNPQALLRYYRAVRKAHKWIDEHPFQCPPDAKYFLEP